jgi:hypothetical protein
MLAHNNTYLGAVKVENSMIFASLIVVLLISLLLVVEEPLSVGRT